MTFYLYFYKSSFKHIQDHQDDNDFLIGQIWWDDRVKYGFSRSDVIG